MKTASVYHSMFHRRIKNTPENVAAGRSMMLVVFTGWLTASTAFSPEHSSFPCHLHGFASTTTTSTCSRFHQDITTHVSKNSLQYQQQQQCRHVMTALDASSSANGEHEHQRSSNSEDELSKASQNWNGLEERLQQPRTPSKADLYSNTELRDLLELHSQLQQPLHLHQQPTEANGASNPAEPARNLAGNVLSIHDQVLGTIQEIEKQDSRSFSASDDNDNGTEPIQDAQEEEQYHDPQLAAVKRKYKVTKEMKGILPHIRAIASDVDGTLICSNGTSVHPFTQRALIHAIHAAQDPNHPLQHFFLATGKTQVGALRSLGPELQAILRPLPGVYIQGLYCVDGNGAVLYEQKLSQPAVRAAEQLAAQFPGLTLLGYDGNAMFAADTANPNHVVEIHDKWGEPVPTLLKAISHNDGDNVKSSQFWTKEGGYHKLLLMLDDVHHLHHVIRPQLEALAQQYDCVVTVAVPTMLELLPPNSGKEVGVERLCQALGITDPSTQLVAIGDGENDAKLLERAAWGVAVGNAVPATQQAANLVLDETNNDGAAGIAIELFGLGKVMDDE